MENKAQQYLDDLLDFQVEIKLNLMLDQKLDAPIAQKIAEDMVHIMLTSKIVKNQYYEIYSALAEDQGVK